MNYNYAIIILIAVSFFTTLVITPWVIRFMRNIGLNVKDMNKKGKPLIPISGGFAVLIGICAGIMVALFGQRFIMDSSEGTATLLAVTWRQ